MNRSRPLAGLPLAALAAAAALASGCGQACTPRPPGAAGAIALEPLPAPPRIAVAPELLPGAGEGLAVVAARPQGPVRGEVRPTVTFSRPVVALGSEAAPPFTLAPPVPGRWRWLGSATAEFVPEGRFPWGTAFTVTVPAGLRAVDGAALAEPYAFSFETARPTVLEVRPEPGWAWLRPDEPVSLVLDQPVKDLAARLRLEAAGREVPFSVEPARVADEERAERARLGRGGPPGADVRGFDDRRIRYAIHPRAPLPRDAEVVLRVTGPIESADGPLALEGTPSWAFRTYGPFRVVDVRACGWDGPCPHGPARLRTTNPVDPATLKGAVTLAPEVNADWDEAEPWRDVVFLPAALRPGTSYEVVVGAGLRDVFGQPLEAAAKVALRTDDPEPALDGGRSLALLEAGGDGAFPLEVTNLPAVEVRLVPLDAGALARLLAQDDPTLPAKPGASGAAERTLDTSAARNARRTVPVPVRDLLGRASGLFAATIEAPALRAARPDRPWTWRRELVGQLTDVAVHAKLGAASGAVWVTRLSDGRPLPGAALALHDRDGAIRWTGTADADGLARVPGLARLLGGAAPRWPGDTPFALVSARVGADVGVTLSTWAGGLDPAAFDVPLDWDGAEPRALGGLFPERGIYRPGETAHVKGLLRVRRLGELATPRSGSVRVRVASARGKEIFAAQVPLTPFGTWAADVPIPADAPLGTFEVTAAAATDAGELEQAGSFRVEEYRAPQFQVDVTAAARERTAREPIRGQVLARYLFGGAMPGAAVRWTATRATTEFEPPGNAGFTFGSMAWGWDDGAPARSADLAASGEGETDAQGQLAIDAGLAEATAGRTWIYTLEAEVADVSRQRLAGRATVTVHPASLYAGVRRRSTGFAQAGRPDALELVAAAPDGARRAGVTVAVEVKRREWRFIRKKGVGGRWFTDAEAVEERAGGCEVETSASPAECTFTPPGPGLYVAEVTLVDERGRPQTTRLPFYAVGAGWVSWQRDDTGRLDLVPDRMRYAPGEVARVLVKSPFPEAEAVVTVEREGVLSARRVRLAGAATTLDVPLGEEAVPNVFVSVVAVRGRVAAAPGEDPSADPGRPEVRVGYARLDVEKRSRRLDVAVMPDAPEKRPRDRLGIAVEVKDHRGRGVEAEVTVWAVDEGVLRLTGYEVPDPVELVHPPRGLSVRIGEPLIHLVERRRYGEKGVTAGGGGGDGAGAGFRSRFQTTILFAPEVRTGADGRATVGLELPDGLTTYRLMAVAVARDDRTGSGQGEVRVAKPLMALPALPRLARAGDRFEAGVVVHAPGGAIREVEVRAEATGLALQGDPVRTVRLEGGRPREVRFPFRADHAGTARLRFTVAGGGERDGLEQPLPIELPVSMEAVAVHGDTAGTRREALAMPGGVRPEAGGLELSLASTALGGFAEDMRQLVEYPYGCLEQLSSRLVPFLALRELQGTFGLPHEPGARPAAPAWLGGEAEIGTRDPDEVVRLTVKAIERLQNPDGGYRYWDSSACSAEWASSYAVLALGRAAELGYPVEKEGLRRGQNYLAETVAAGRCTRCGTSCPAPWDATRVFALYALARTGAPRASFHGEVFARRETLPLFGRAMLADAMFLGGSDREAARTALQEVLAQARETPSEVHLEEVDDATYAPLWSSDARTTAIALATLAAVTPDHPYVAKMAAWLAGARRGDGRFRNTQEAAFALIALSEVVRAREREAPDFVARAVMGGSEVAAVPFRGRSTEVRVERIPMAALPQGKGGVPLELRRDGTAGRLHYGALLRYAPASMPVEPLERGLFVQRWFEPYGGGGQVRGARSGDLVRVRVRVATAQERHFVAVSVPLPAGLEIVDTSLATTAAVQEEEPRLGEESEEGAGGEEGELGDDLEDGEPDLADAWAFRFWSPFNHEERRDARLVLFADTLPPGLHVATFVARATTPGDFVLMPAQAEEMYAPEVFGRSDGGTFRVVTGEARAGR